MRDKEGSEEYKERARAIEMALFGEDNPRFRGPAPGTLAYRRPTAYVELPEEEVDLRGRCNEDFCIVDDKRFFIRGVLDLPIRETGTSFSWGVWAEVTQINFERYGGFFAKGEMSNDPPILGRLANELATYPGSEGLEVRVCVHPKLRPSFLVVAEDHPLGVDQRAGILPERVAQFWKALA